MASADVLKFEGLHRTFGDVSPKSEQRDDGKQDLPFALDLVARAASSIQAVEKRLRETESWAISAVKRSRDDLAAAKAQIVSYEEKLRASEKATQDLQSQASASKQHAEIAYDRAGKAEERAEIAEARAARAEKISKDAEASLMRIHDAIRKHLACAVSSVEKLASTPESVANLETRINDSATNVRSLSPRMIASIPDRVPLMIATETALAG